MQLRKWLIEKLGGYTTRGFTIDEAIEEIRSKNLKERHIILTMAVKKLYNTIGADDILKPGGGGQWMLEGKMLSKGQIELLQSEAHHLENMLLWKVIKKDVLYQVNRKMYLQAENIEHVITSKFWLYTFDTIRTRLKSILAGSALYNSSDEKRS